MLSAEFFVTVQMLYHFDQLQSPSLELSSTIVNHSNIVRQMGRGVVE